MNMNEKREENLYKHNTFFMFAGRKSLARWLILLGHIGSFFIELFEKLK
jgi:hypothetical protein